MLGRLRLTPGSTSFARALGILVLAVLVLRSLGPVVDSAAFRISSAPSALRIPAQKLPPPSATEVNSCECPSKSHLASCSLKRASMSEQLKDDAGAGLTPVYLKVYDLSRGMASMISMPLLGFQMDGLWHTSIAVFGNEYLFGQGISYCEEARCEEATNLPLTRKILLGETSVTKELFHEYIDSLQVTFSPESYHLLRWNCNHFTNTAAEFLTGNGIPDEYVKMIDRIEQSPSGKIVLGLIEKSFNRDPSSFSVPTGR
ncbi:PPPDE peptidase domain-containing protein [Babesia bigemina]|uniref:PPPDE peptidase domain-containing protein n=1 Tax=Babesia bigemina TaxID=5866 RepID=A0A061DBA0_BABBI|nr:PPPDE peptidase domain-containing protein [Babesia bigemina]CDR95020.1 PPPDE peptidase domain-containing protein [Babesia bigemina]|eukprot:XP_012767206.1 PPPDE peptidase domain-containing protein [Babesia bigemina]